MTLITDKTHQYTRTALPTEVNKKAGDLIVSYLPTAFDTLTRGIHTKTVRAELVKRLPFIEPAEISLICSYLDNRTTLLYLLDHLADQTIVIGELMQAIENTDWENPVFQRPYIDQYLLEAVRQGLLTEFEFSSLCLMQTAAKQWNRWPRVEYLLEDGVVDPSTLRLVESTFSVLPKNPLLVGAKPAPLLSPKQVDQFTVELRFFSPTEHFVLLQPMTALPHEHIFSGIQRLALNLFGQVAFPHTVTSQLFSRTISLTVPHSQMIAPLGMIQAFLNVKFGENAVQLLPAIGPLGVAELTENGLYGTRVVSLHHSLLDQLTGLRLPFMADGLQAPGVYFTYHDGCYHSYLSSSIPHILRRRFIEFTEVMRKHRDKLLEKDDPEAETFFRKVGFKCTDMEHTSFRPEVVDARSAPHRNPLQVFWHSIAATLRHELGEVIDGTGYCRISRLCKFLIDQQKLSAEDRDAIRAEGEKARKSRYDKMIGRILQRFEWAFSLTPP